MSSSSPTQAAIARMALSLTCQDWSDLGHGNDPNVAASTDIDTTIERLVALFVIRIVALLAHRSFLKTRSRIYSNLSTTTICQASLQEDAVPWDLSPDLLRELRTYVESIVNQYNAVPYHNFEHAYHVTISANKLLDLMLHQADASNLQTYGLKSDPLVHLALIFSALVHDVEHQGVPNRQLVLESDRLALLYNDQSVAEQRSLAVAFRELTQPHYQLLRTTLFESMDEYRRFRKAVINLVLTTDIASPERTQIVKSKWKEAFGDALKKNEDNMSEASTSLTPESMEALEGSAQDFLDALPTSHSDDGPLHARSSTCSTAAEILALPQEGGNSRPARRRFSMPTGAFDMKKAHVRLGIRRSLDLTGEAIEPFAETLKSSEDDVPDELRASVVLEQLLKAADVAPNMQGWHPMTKWSSRLFMELMDSYTQGRGEDPRQGWYQNQITFLESYMLPLARRLHDTKAFGDGAKFARIVKENRDRWISEGVRITEQVNQEWIQRQQKKNTEGNNNV